MNIYMVVAGVCLAWCVCAAAGAPEPRLARKQQRPTRGFKNVEMMTARGFGKRDRPTTRAQQTDVPRPKFNPKSNLLVATDFGKRSFNNEDMDEVYGLDNFWEMLENNPEKDSQEFNDERSLESIPVDWFVSELLNNPEFARTVVRKFIDLNQDGMLSSDELLRNVV